MHPPTAREKCLACHVALEPRDHTFKLASAPEKLCADCHPLPHRSVEHAPVKQGKCTECHDPHGSGFRAMLKADPARDLCVRCHKPEGGSGKSFVHGPVAMGACVVCHEVHSSWQPKLLVEAGSKLCLRCHQEMSTKGDQWRHVHDPAKEDCIACHDPHASDNKYQLRQSTPDLCLKCHPKVAATMAASANVHGAATQPGGCVTCHSPHFSSLPKLQKTAQPEECLTGCHDHALVTASGQKLTNMGDLLKENPQQHGPIREGACVSCHNPHAGDRFRLLAADYPAEFYAPFKLEEYSLCFGCHISDLVLKKQGTGLTRFRNGDVNLHALHVNQDKGRTCRACHEVHASQEPAHIRDAVPFGAGGWMLQINFKQTATGGNCAPGCHEARSYDRGAVATASGPATTPAPASSRSPTTQEFKP
jgi:predicted CXXCH cytochrome family protein